MQSKKIDFRNVVIGVLAITIALILKLNYVDRKESFSIFPHKDIINIIENTDEKISDETTIAPIPNVANENQNGNDEEMFKVVDEALGFPGCEDNRSDDEKKKCADEQMLQYLYKNIKYPIIAKENGVQSRVVVTFVVEKDGRITVAKVVREIGGGCGEESLHVVNSMNQMVDRWTPGINGNAVRVQFNIPVEFKLS